MSNSSYSIVESSVSSPPACVRLDAQRRAVCPVTHVKTGGEREEEDGGKLGSMTSELENSLHGWSGHARPVSRFLRLSLSIPPLSLSHTFQFLLHVCCLYFLITECHGYSILIRASAIAGKGQNIRICACPKVTVSLSPFDIAGKARLMLMWFCVVLCAHRCV